MTVLVDARVALFGALIDYAGMFPPASLDLRGAVAEFRAIRGGRTGWIAGRFLCPASQLEDLAEVLTRTMEPGEAPWEVSVIFDGDPGADAASANAFDEELDPAATVVITEIKIPPDAGPEAVAALFTAGSLGKMRVTAFLEVPITEHWEREIGYRVVDIDDARREAHLTGGAKLRCGGATAPDVPSPEQVTRFLVACRERNLPYKFTAGLHHPIRHHDDELGAMRHGFLNLLTASVIALDNASEPEILAAIDETDPDAFSVTAGGMRWRDRRVGTKAVIAARSMAMVGFGSCDFDEPVAALDTMMLLPPGGGR
jgi:hypothetical protein